MRSLSDHQDGQKWPCYRAQADHWKRARRDMLFSGHHLLQGLQAACSLQLGWLSSAGGPRGPASPSAVHTPPGTAVQGLVAVIT